jgi:hypothetical protein
MVWKHAQKWTSVAFDEVLLPPPHPWKPTIRSEVTASFRTTKELPFAAGPLPKKNLV